MNTKHGEVNPTKHALDTPSPSKDSQAMKEEISVKKLHPLNLKVIMEKCAQKITQDYCYPDDFRNQFCDLQFSTNNAVELWTKIRSAIDSFEGDSEKFYATCFGLMSENLLPEHFSQTFTTNTLLQEGWLQMFSCICQGKPKK